MGLPVLHDYYRATQSDQLKAWFDPIPEKQWVILEKVMISNVDLKALLLARATQQTVYVPDHPSISTNLAAWDHLFCKQNTSSSLSLITLLLRAYVFLICSFSVKACLDRGYCTLVEVLAESQKGAHYKLPKIRHFQQKFPDQYIRTEETMWNYYHKRGWDFVILFSPTSCTVCKISTFTVLKWEQDLGQVFSEEEWQ